ncbi:GTP-binding protein [Spironucleus salmonicida]|uniref:GTP-binding protein n=1 Tax=Spironucleus salmonicida TaxID=348837 RepID=V6LN87_9EUKA|nr:GTP-binding protein [Spironucleus salmonicida]|eukprot:EST42179.1 GTP-binding protein [Spironucleus salmonicida]
MGKHRTARKYTGAIKIEKNSFLGNAVQNSHQLTKTAHFEQGLEHYQSSSQPLKSVTEEGDFASVLSKAERATKEFEAKTRIASSFFEVQESTKTQQNFMKTNTNLLRIPRRPNWNKQTTPQQLHNDEVQQFYLWREAIAELEQTRVVELSPFEKNLDFWRQLWRVVEFSDVLLQIVDARNPLLFYSRDLVKYVAEVGRKQKREKRCILILNKADLVPLAAREKWAKYFEEREIDFVYFSALREEAFIKLLSNLEKVEKQEQQEKELRIRMGKETVDFDAIEQDIKNELNKKNSSESEEEQNEEFNPDFAEESNQRHRRKRQSFEAINRYATEKQQKQSKKQLKLNQRKENIDDKLRNLIPVPRVAMHTDDHTIPHQFDIKDVLLNNASLPAHIFSPRIYTREELSDLLSILSSTQLGLQINPRKKATIGTIGYPNIGKSSTVNVLALQTGSKTAVGETPGKTKHFQTLELSEQITLCDCPGLIFPSFAHCRADFILNGILPIDQEREYQTAISLLCKRIPAQVFEQVYGVQIMRPEKFSTGVGMAFGEVKSSVFYTNWSDLLTAMTLKTGFEQGQCARRIVKDIFKGKLRWVQLPPIGVQKIEKSQKIIMKRHNDEDTENALGREMARFLRLQRKSQEAQNGVQQQEQGEEDFEGEEESAE